MTTLLDNSASPRSTGLSPLDSRVISTLWDVVEFLCNLMLNTLPNCLLGSATSQALVSAMICSISVWPTTIYCQTSNCVLYTHSKYNTRNTSCQASWHESVVCLANMPFGKSFTEGVNHLTEIDYQCQSHNRPLTMNINHKYNPLAYIHLHCIDNHIPCVICVGCRHRRPPPPINIILII